MDYFDNLYKIVTKSNKPYDVDKIKKAYEYAKKAHEGQYRNSGEEYITHPVAVAETVATYSLDTDSICAALLHDTLEDCPEVVSLSTIKKEFGDNVAELVDGLTKLLSIKVDSKEEAQIESLRKMFIAMAKDIRVIIIKLADRLHNMRTLSSKSETRQREIALETMHVYAPLAHRLGMQQIKTELECLSLKFLDPVGYAEVNKDIERKFGENQHFIENIKQEIAGKIKEANITYELEGRVKSVYSIYKKMYNFNKSFDEIYDFYAIRIIVDTEQQCYEVLGIIHNMYNLIPGRFKDYISLPKPNLYRSLHTTVIGTDGIPFEVQIRTWDMHYIAEYGIAAHWKYKSGEKANATVDHKLEWVAKLIENEEIIDNPDDFYDSLKIDLFQDEIYVFTPRGQIVTLPKGSNTIDFAYYIHSEVGNKMIGAKVNGAIVPIDRKLNNGEIVEIITSNASKGPSRDWLSIVTTASAKSKIRQWFKKEKRTENIESGKNQILSEMRSHNMNCTDEQYEEIVLNSALKFGMNNAEDLYNMIGYGGISFDKVFIRIRAEYDTMMAPKPEMITDVAQVHTVQKPKSASSFSGVIVDGLEGCQVKFSKCCNPLPGDNIIGFITKGFGISVHKVDCENVLKNLVENKDRFVNVQWREAENNVSNETFDASLQLIVEDRISMLADITMALAEMRVSILQINTVKKGNTSIINLNISCKNVAHLNNIMSKLKSISGIYEVKRGYV